MDKARASRDDPSAAENLMWELLRGSRTGFKFRREHAIGGYRLDFFCHEALLDVEMDGEQHVPEKDALRDEALSASRDHSRRLVNEEEAELCVAAIRKVNEVAGGWPHNGA